MLNPLKLYTDLELIKTPNTHTFLLIPLLGDYLKTEGDPDTGRFDEFIKSYANYIQFVKTPEACDYFLYPITYSFEPSEQKISSSFIAKAKQLNKKVILFFNSDDDRVINLENTLVFRTSFYKSDAVKNTFALPGWSADFINHFPNKTLNYLAKTEIPSVSYCGYIDYIKPTLKQQLKSFLFPNKINSKINATALRGLACRKLLHNKKTDTRFVIRDGFWAQGIPDKIKARQEYANNMMNSLYAIVMRGAGNFSYRLYEVLSCGRIPIFINTDCALPFDDTINWKNHVVWIEEKDINKIAELLLNFHQSKSEEELLLLQKQNRELYLNHLSPQGFFKTFANYLLSIK
jgi:hypothetical protein